MLTVYSRRLYVKDCELFAAATEAVLGSKAGLPESPIEVCRPVKRLDLHKIEFGLVAISYFL